MEDVLVNIGVDTSEFNQGLDKANQKIGSFGNAVSNAGSKTGGLMGGLKGLTGGILGMASPMGLAIGGIGALGAGLIAATQAASEEAVGIERLNTTLKNAIPGWDGNASAIDAYIAKQEQLAFADDELRDSLGFLVGQTKDLGEAQALQATAMDLARAKGISLEAATKAVGKVDAESIGILKRLGIEVTDQMSKEEALTAIRAASAGQAETYANTAAGSMDRVHNAFGNALEDIGAVLLPKVTEAMGGLADFLSSPAFSEGLNFLVDLVGGSLTRSFDMLSTVISAVSTVLQPIIGFVQQFISGIQAGADPLQSFGDLIGNIGTYLADLGGKALQAIGAALPGIITKIGEWATAFIAWIGPMIPPFLAKLGELLGSLANWIFTVALPAIITKLGEWAKAFVDWVGPQIPPLLQKLGELLGSLANWIFTVALPAIITKLGEWAKAFIDWIGPQIPPLLVKLGEFAQSIWTWITGTALPAAITKLGEFAAAFLDWVGTDVLPFIGAKLGEFAQAIWNWITQAAKDAANKVKSIGAAIVQGIKDGIAAAWQAFLNWINGILAGLPQVIKDFFGIKSPSTLMAGFGMDIGMGLAEGIKGSIPLVKDAMKGLTGTPPGFTLGGGFGTLPATTPGGLGIGRGGNETLNIHIDGVLVGSVLSNRLGTHRALTTPQPPAVRVGAV